MGICNVCIERTCAVCDKCGPHNKFDCGSLNLDLEYLFLKFALLERWKMKPDTGYLLKVG